MVDPEARMTKAALKASAALRSGKHVKAEQAIVDWVFGDDKPKPEKQISRIK